jgi:hypothetical protein
MIKWVLIKFVVIRIQLTESDVISSPGFLSDSVGWSDLVRSYGVRCRIDGPGPRGKKRDFRTSHTSSYSLVLPSYSSRTPFVLPSYSLRTPLVLPWYSLVLPRTPSVLGQFVAGQFVAWTIHRNSPVTN